MAGWESYVDYVIQKGAESAAIYGKDGEIWDVSSGMAIQSDEAGTFLNDLIKREFTIHHVFNTIKYVKTASSGGTLNATSEDGTLFLTAALSNQCLIIGTSKDKENKGVLELRDMLNDAGF